MSVFNPKISVIIPVFNVENYIRQCINSVLNQSYKNIEIILVDDGSNDNSPGICDEYSVNFPDIIKVIHKSNGGLSDARNAGIACATGDYVAFLDGDDYWDCCDALSALVHRLSVFPTDVLNFSYKKHFDADGTTEIYFKTMSSMPLSLDTKQQQLHFLFDNNLYIASACNKLIRRTLLNDTLLFERGVYSEDIEWCAMLLSKAESFDFIAEEFYSYRQRSNSISHTVNDKKCGDLCKHILECMSMISDAPDTEKGFLSIYSAYQFGTFFVVQALAENFQEECINKLNAHAKILKHHNKNKKIIVLRILCLMLGYKNTCRLIRLLYTPRRK